MVSRATSDDSHYNQTTININNDNNNDGRAKNLSPTPIGGIFSCQKSQLVPTVPSPRFPVQRVIYSMNQIMVVKWYISTVPFH